MANDEAFDFEGVGTSALLGSVKVEDEEAPVTPKQEPVSDEEYSLHSGSENEPVTCSASTSPVGKGVWPELMIVDGKDDEDGSSGMTDDPLTVNYLCQVTMDGETAGDVTKNADEGSFMEVKSEAVSLSGPLSDGIPDSSSGSGGYAKKQRKKRGISCDYKPKKCQKSNRCVKIHAGKKRESCDYRSREPSMDMDACEKLYACEYCDYTSSNACYLKKHMRVHTGSKPFSCSVCHLSFARTCHLKQHMRTHTGEKPYACDICFYRFSQTSSLNRHMTIHTGEKPHSCDVCGNVYRQKSQLARHVRTHVSEQYYTCDVCGYICNHLPSLTNHKRIHIVPL